ncbi:ATP-binding protein [Streptomyces sp. NPDC088196]|uniref:ATP-binding protein n=1 Tax=Streptomyces sp. NPDC088196 TaxID=3154868 RepID=UPI003450E916
MHGVSRVFERVRTFLFRPSAPSGLAVAYAGPPARPHVPCSESRQPGFSRRSLATALVAAPVEPQRHSARYPAAEESVPRVRHAVTAALSDWGLSQLADVAGLVVSELATNAAIHTGAATFGASVTRTSRGSVRIVVTDTSRTRPAPVATPGEDEHGRGLLLVAALADGWGSELVHGGKRVWADLSVTAVP